MGCFLLLIRIDKIQSYGRIKLSLRRNAMSLVLSNSKPDGLTAKTFGDLCRSNSGEQVVIIGDYVIPMSDFVVLVMYVLTNSELDENDPRLQLVAQVKNMGVVPDFLNEGRGTRLTILNGTSAVETGTANPPPVADNLKQPRHILIKGVDTGRICPPGYDYCWQCGHVARPEEFQKNDHCPSPACPHPTLWND